MTHSQNVSTLCYSQSTNKTQCDHNVNQVLWLYIKHVSYSYSIAKKSGWIWVCAAGLLWLIVSTCVSCNTGQLTGSVRKPFTTQNHLASKHKLSGARREGLRRGPHMSTPHNEKVKLWCKYPGWPYRTHFQDLMRSCSAAMEFKWW